MGKVQLGYSMQREEFLQRLGFRSVSGLFEVVQVVKFGPECRGERKQEADH